MNEAAAKPLVQLGLAGTIIVGTVAAVGAFQIGKWTLKGGKAVGKKFFSKKDKADDADNTTSASSKKDAKKSNEGSDEGEGLKEITDSKPANSKKKNS